MLVCHVERFLAGLLFLIAFSALVFGAGWLVLSIGEWFEQHVPEVVKDAVAFLILAACACGLLFVAYHIGGEFVHCGARR